MENQTFFSKSKILEKVVKQVQHDIYFCSKSINLKKIVKQVQNEKHININTILIIFFLSFRTCFGILQIEDNSLFLNNYYKFMLLSLLAFLINFLFKYFIKTPMYVDITITAIK